MDVAYYHRVLVPALGLRVVGARKKVPLCYACTAALSCTDNECLAHPHPMVTLPYAYW